jgi:hypothetical protein
MTTHYFTFGSDHLLPDGSPAWGKVVRVDAPRDHRELFMAWLGSNKFSSEYTEAEAQASPHLDLGQVVATITASEDPTPRYEAWNDTGVGIPCPACGAEWQQDGTALDLQHTPGCDFVAWLSAQDTQTVRVTIGGVTRLPQSGSGNPRWRLYTDRGIFTTDPDTADAYVVSDGWQHVRATLTLDNGQVIGIDVERTSC